MRIISLSPAVTETIFALGAQKHLIGVTYFCNYPPQAKILPKVGGFSFADVKRIKTLKSDLVITQTVVQDKAIEVFKKAKIPHLHLDPRRLTDIYENLLKVGKVVKEYQRAKRLVEKMKRQELAHRKNRLTNNQQLDKPRIYCEEWYDPPMASGNWVPDIIKLAGGISFMPADGKPSRKVSLEEVLEFDPDVILLAYCGFGYRSDPNRILKRPGWEIIPAIKEGKIFSVDEEVLNRPGPRILSVVNEIQHYLHK